MTEEFKFDGQTRELISVAASVAANCLPCLRYHFAEAVRLGSPIEAIRAAGQIGLTTKERPRNDMLKLFSDLASREHEAINR
ncbi:MAG: carboxymuconolactone decarboxylase family protein [Bacteroidetes bacterium]|nr:carboxymuconolactone decarboxylase family protein [Bacteroidota bacterium]